MIRGDGMVDISTKDVTVRTAKAGGKVILGDKAFEILEAGTCAKGDVLATAKVAALQAAKSTPALIPMCHPIMIESVDIDFAEEKREGSITVIATAKSSGKTGVEMEALTAVSVACLTIYDMLKYVGKDTAIDKVMLLCKTGGKSGEYQRQN
jgi:cyclic pyranopterin phosphate synthase